jgi:ATP-dependent exoDNAse (exonuclease V) alpha subunit
MAEIIAKAAQHYLSLSPSQREKTLVIATSRAARDALNEQIREGLKSQGVLQGPEVKLESLSPTGWTRAEAKHLANYNIETQSENTKSDGLVVRFGRAYKSLQIVQGEYGKVVGIDESKEVVRLQMQQDGREVLWNPERHTKVEIFESRQKELSSGDVIRWTRNDSDSGIRNGETALIRDIQSDGIAKVQLLNGEVKEIDLNAQRHWDHGYAGTIFSAQGRTSESVIAIMPSNSPLSDQRSAYVAISRAKESAYLYTDSKSELLSGLQERTGEPSTALERVERDQVIAGQERPDQPDRDRPDRQQQEKQEQEQEIEIQRQEQEEKEKEQMEWELELGLG